MLYLIFF